MREADARPTGRDEIVESLTSAAERLFALYGVDKVTVREIANEARVNPGLVHRHFDGKSALVAATFTRTADKALELLDGVEDAGEAASVLFDFARQHPAFAKTLASVLLGSTEPAAVLPSDGPIRRLRLIMQQHGGPDYVNDFLTVLAIGFGWSVFSPAMQVLSATDADDFDAHARRVSERIRDIANGVS